MNDEHIVKLYLSANEALEYKYELIAADLIQDVDFQWAWHSPALTNDRAYVEFFFKNPSYATLYRLKWE